MLYFTPYFRLFKYMVSFRRYFTVCITYQPSLVFMIDCVWKVMAHAQKPDFVFRWKRRVQLNRREASVQSTAGSRGVRNSGSNAGYTMFRGSVKSTGYPLHLPVSPSHPLPWVTVCHHVSAGLYSTGSVVECTFVVCSIGQDGQVRAILNWEVIFNRTRVGVVWRAICQRVLFVLHIL